MGLLRSLLTAALRPYGLQIVRSPHGRRSVYDADGLMTWNKNLDFIRNARFESAYRKGMNSGHAIDGPEGVGKDIHIEWRVAVCCWAASHAAKLPGDFVECGVNSGICSLSICDYIGFNETGKFFWLFDTYDGIPEAQMAEKDDPNLKRAHNHMYRDMYATAAANFAPYGRAKLIRGSVPETLTTVAIDRVAYLSIDMNIAYPERAAIEFFWPKLSPGAVVVLDDYGWLGFEAQKETMDEFARKVGVEIMTLPTGQGVILKP